MSGFHLRWRSLSSERSWHLIQMNSDPIPNSGIDYTGEIAAAFSELKTLLLTSDIRDICPCDVYIVCVPTPIDSSKSPDLNPLIEATRIVGNALTKDNVVLLIHGLSRRN